MLEKRGKLHALITQNIDGLHGRAGQRELAEIHGNARLVRCIECTSRWPREEIPTEVLPPAVRARLAVEAGLPLSWWRLVGDGGDVVGA